MTPGLAVIVKEKAKREIKPDREQVSLTGEQERNLTKLCDTNGIDITNQIRWISWCTGSIQGSQARDTGSSPVLVDFHNNRMPFCSFPQHNN